MKRLIDYQAYLLESLKDQQTASQYLNAALQDEDPRIFVLAINNALEAQRDKEHLQILHPIEDDPTFADIKAALDVLELKLVIQARSDN